MLNRGAPETDEVKLHSILSASSRSEKMEPALSMLIHVLVLSRLSGLSFTSLHVVRQSGASGGGGSRLSKEIHGEHLVCKVCMFDLCVQARLASLVRDCQLRNVWRPQDVFWLPPGTPQNLLFTIKEEQFRIQHVK